MDPLVVLQQMLPVVGDDQERCYRYTDLETRRVFNIRRVETQVGYRFWLTEGMPLLTESLRKLEAEFGPNRFIAAAMEAGVEIAALRPAAPTMSVESLHLESLTECADSIAKCLRTNVRYNALRDLSAEERASLEHADSAQSAAYWGSLLDKAIEAEAKEFGLFKGCHDLLGNPLTSENKGRILSYLNDPVQSSWIAIRNMAIARNTTLWQSWLLVDEKATKLGNVGYPSPSILREAIRAAVERNKRLLESETARRPKGLRLC